MSGSTESRRPSLASAHFRDAAAPPATTGKRTVTRPFSIRFTEEERARLERRAGRKPLGAYIRAKLLGEEETKRRSSARPGSDHKALALALGELGRSRLASNMNQIAKAANMGVLDSGPELAADLAQACADIAAMRTALITALGVKPEPGG